MPVDQEGGFDIVHQRFEMPAFISNRSFFNTYYHIDGSEPGEYQFIVSGRGNEHFVKKHKSRIGRDVVGRVNLNYMGIKPIRNLHGDVIGTHIQQVQNINPNGSLPDWYKKKKAWKQGRDGILSMVTYL